MLKRVPEHIFWPGMVVAILSMSVIANIWLLYNAQSDGGAQIIDDYYTKASAWDDKVELDEASTRKGWTVATSIGGLEDGQRRVTFAVRDRAGQPVTGLASKVTVKNPMKVDDVATRDLAENAPGVYMALMPFSRSGLWDIHFTVGSGEPVFLHETRIEVDR